jgi:hypothetical protein
MKLYFLGLLCSLPAVLASLMDDSKPAASFSSSYETAIPEEQQQGMSVLEGERGDIKYEQRTLYYQRNGMQYNARV